MTITPVLLDRDQIEVDYELVRVALTNAAAGDSALVAFEKWEQLRRRISGWKSLAELRLRQDTTDAERKADAERVAALAPVFDQYDADVKRLLLANRRPLETILGRHVFARWEADFDTVSARVLDDLSTERRLGDQYTTLLTGLRCDFRANCYSLTEMGRFLDVADRSERREAALSRWSAVNAAKDQLDEIFDRLVRTRTAIAERLEQATFVDVAYKRMGRVDYGRDDVAAFRREIVDTVVPLCSHLAREQAKAIGVDRLMPWDEQTYDLLPPIRPPRTEDIMPALQGAFADMHPDLGRFVDEIVEQQLYDIDARPTKSGGAFCTYLAHVGMPFVYASTGTTAADVLSVIHEAGHAFQTRRCNAQPALELIMAGEETAEIHSMALEFLAWPYLERFFGAQAERYRRRHLRERIALLPYIAAIDHFQETVYENPGLSPYERHAVWRDLEGTYTPWKTHGGIAALERGARWQLQRHVYRFPFYYIDYGLALCCALQVWSASRRDYAGAVNAYVALCERGGRLPFRALIASAGLRSPFDTGTLGEVCESVVEVLSRG